MQKAQDNSSDAYSELISVDGIGSSVAIDLLKFCSEEHNKKILDNLAELLEVKDFHAPKVSTSIIAGKTLVFTGVMESLSRAEAKNQAESLGAKVASNVSRKTDYVIIGANAGSKEKKAKELGVSTLSEKEWVELIS